MKNILRTIILILMCLSVALTSYAEVTNIIGFYDSNTDTLYAFGTFGEEDIKVGFEFRGKSYPLEDDQFEKSQNSYSKNIFGIGFNGIQNLTDKQSIEVIPYSVSSSGNTIKGEAVTLDAPIYSNANLKSITIDGNVLEYFSPDVTEYYVGVENEKICELDISALPVRPDATVGKPVKDHSRRQYTITVTAPDGITKNTYYIKYRTYSEAELSWNHSRYGYNASGSSAHSSGFVSTKTTALNENGKMTASTGNNLGYMLFKIDVKNAKAIEVYITPGDKTSVSNYSYYQYNADIETAVTTDETTGAYIFEKSYTKGMGSSSFYGFTDSEEYYLGNSVITDTKVTQPTVKLDASKLKISDNGFIIICVKKDIKEDSTSYYYAPTLRIKYVTEGDVLYTEDSVAELTSATPSYGELYPEFQSDVHSYHILAEKFDDTLPDIAYTNAERMTVSYVKSNDINTPSTITVTSPDGQITDTYTFNYSSKSSAVISADKIAVKSSSGTPDIFSLPLADDSVSLSRAQDDMTYLSFNKFIFGNTDSKIKSLTLDIWAKSDSNDNIEVYRNTQYDWNNIISDTMGEEGILHDTHIISEGEYKNYKIELNPENFTSFSSIDLIVKGDIDIWCGINGVETSGKLRVPVIEAEYYDISSPELTLKWADRYIKDLGTEYNDRPANNYISEQNPPTFFFPYVEGATGYDIIVCSDKELKNVKYFVSNISINMHNFICEFLPGTYYWSARYKTADGISEWSEAKRFTVRPDAYSYPVPDITVLSDKFASMSHPRIIVNEDTIDEFRALKDTSKVSKYYYGLIIDSADSVVTNSKVDTFAAEPEHGLDEKTLKDAVYDVTEQIFNAALAYLITENDEYAEAAKIGLLRVAEWELDPEIIGEEGGSTSYKYGDQMYRTLVIECSIAYDWLYNYMNEEERNKVADMLIKRAIYEEHPAEGLQDATYKLVTSPYLSHGTGHMNAVLTASIALADKSTTLKGFIDTYLPIAIADGSWKYQDGAYANGFAYSTYFSEHPTVQHSLSGIINKNLSAAENNNWKFYFYTAFNTGSMEFGDESYGYVTRAIVYLLRKYAQRTDNPYAKWKYEYFNIDSLTTVDGYYDAYGTDVEAKEPTDLPKSHLFKDAGYVAMHSDLMDDENRVSLYFRSSQYGSRNHSHPDQNSFHIHAYGERLAIDSGYYDSYYSEFDKGYTRKTYAHNAITYDGGQGQPIGTTLASGEVTNFITSQSFDLTTGSAAKAYNSYINSDGYGYYYDTEKVAKADRHIIYVRPDSFIVIDDLKAGNGEEYNFEWWLNAYKDIKFKEDKIGAVITRNNAQLEAEVVYPADMQKGELITTFSGPDGVIYNPTGSYANMPVHQRVWFETPKTNETKIVTVMNVHKKDGTAKEITSESFENYIKLTFEDETVAYINTTGVSEITADGYTFSGEALVVKGESFMLVDGTSLIKDGTDVITADKKVSVALEDNHLSVSSMNDVKVEIASETVIGMTDENDNKIKSDEIGYGASWNYNNGILEVNTLCGFYSLYLQ